MRGERSMLRHCRGLGTLNLLFLSQCLKDVDIMFKPLKTFIMYKVYMNLYISKDVRDDAVFVKDTDTFVDVCALVSVAS